MKLLHKSQLWRDFLWALLMFKQRRKGRFVFPGLCYFSDSKREEFLAHADVVMHTQFDAMKSGV